MDMAHISEFHAGIELHVDDEFPMQMGAGSVDPELIEPRESAIDIEDLIAFYSL